MPEHDPKTALAKIIRFNKQNPKEYETVGPLIKGQAAALRRLHKLREDEPEPEKYAYYWTWVNKTAALEYAEQKEGLKLKAGKKTDI